MGQLTESLKAMQDKQPRGMLVPQDVQDAALVVITYLQDKVVQFRANPPQRSNHYGDRLSISGVRLTQTKLGISLQCHEQRAAWLNLHVILEHLPMSLVWDTTTDDWEISTYTTS